MAQTIQIVPKYSFPYVETHINDYTTIAEDEVVVTPDVVSAYAVVSSKGVDNVWVRKSSRASATKTYGSSNFKLYGQPLMQALETVAQNNSKVWFMRVMPENAAYANAAVSLFYKADTEAEVEEAHLRKFRIKTTYKTFEDVTDSKEFVEKAKELDGPTINVDGDQVYVDGEGFTQAPLMAVRYVGRGSCGNLYSMRISKSVTYEKEYGISMFNFEVLTSENGLERDANYVGAFVSSLKYGNETATFINDLLEESSLGDTPIIVNAFEENVEVVFNAYIKFLKQLHIDLQDEYEAKLVEFNIPEDQLNGLEPVEEEYYDNFMLLKHIEDMIDETADENLPTSDEFDPIFGKKVASETLLTAIAFPTVLTDDVDTTDENYNPADFTDGANIVDFSSTKGLKLYNGNNGYFDQPRTEVIDGVAVQWTLEDEITDCYKKAYSGVYDKKILSPRRIGLNVLWDANYPFEVKEVMADLMLARNDARLQLDCGIINSASESTCKALIEKYSVFKDRLISLDLHNYMVKETTTSKRCNVTISYFLAPAYVNHVVEYGNHIPFVKDYCQLSGHVRDSLLPCIEEYDNDIKELLYNNRINYFECMSENVFQRAVQNTTQMDNSDLLEENNVRVLYVLKHEIENDIQGQLYNFSDESTRQSFCEVEKAKYAPWVGTLLQSFNISFATSQYEFERSILHAYVTIVFRGLNKKAIVEIDINKRSYTSLGNVDGSQG